MEVEEDDSREESEVEVDSDHEDESESQLSQWLGELENYAKVVYHMFILISTHPLINAQRALFSCLRVLCHRFRLAPVLKTIFYQCFISSTCRWQFFHQVSYRLSRWLCFKDLKTEPSELDWLQVYDMKH